MLLKQHDTLSVCKVKVKGKSVSKLGKCFAFTHLAETGQHD